MSFSILQVSFGLRRGFQKCGVADCRILRSTFGPPPPHKMEQHKYSKMLPVILVRPVCGGKAAKGIVHRGHLLSILFRLYPCKSGYIPAYPCMNPTMSLLTSRILPPAKGGESQPPSSRNLEEASQGILAYWFLVANKGIESLPDIYPYSLLRTRKFGLPSIEWSKAGFRVRAGGAKPWQICVLSARRPRCKRV